MVAVTDKTQHLLTMQTAEIIRQQFALDWNRDRFDIEFGLQNGTTYNSFLIGVRDAL